MFAFCSVLICVEIPGLLGVKFNLNSESIGLNFISNIVGYVGCSFPLSVIEADTKAVNRGVIGELISGPLLDFFRNRRTRRNPSAIRPEHHLWLAYPAYALCIAGFVVFCVTLEQAAEGRWNIRPDIGLAICAAGNQMMTTVLFTCKSTICFKRGLSGTF